MAAGSEGKAVQSEEYHYRPSVNNSNLQDIGPSRKVSFDLSDENFIKYFHFWLIRWEFHKRLLLTQQTLPICFLAITVGIQCEPRLLALRLFYLCILNRDEDKENRNNQWTDDIANYQCSKKICSKVFLILARICLSKILINLPIHLFMMNQEVTVSNHINILALGNSLLNPFIFHHLVSCHESPEICRANIANWVLPSRDDISHLSHSTNAGKQSQL